MDKHLDTSLRRSIFANARLCQILEPVLPYAQVFDSLTQLKHRFRPSILILDDAYLEQNQGLVDTLRQSLNNKEFYHNLGLCIFSNDIKKVQSLLEPIYPKLPVMVSPFLYSLKTTSVKATSLEATSKVSTFNVKKQTLENFSEANNFEHYHLNHLLQSLWLKLKTMDGLGTDPKARNFFPLKKNYSKNQKKDRQILRHMLSIAYSLTRETDFDNLVETILYEVSRLVCADGGSIFLVEEKKEGAHTRKLLRFKKSLLQQENLNELTLPLDDSSVAGYVALTKRSLRIRDAYSLSGNEPFTFNTDIDTKCKYRTQSILAVPMLSHNNEVIGVLQLINRREKSSYFDSTKTATPEDAKGFSDKRACFYPFTRMDIIVAEAVASQSSMAIRNNIFLNEQRALFESFIHLIDNVIDSKSKYTGRHCSQVPILTQMITQSVCETKTGRFADFNLNDDEWYELRIAAGLHDCGKIATPVHVMDKATKLETIFDRIELISLRLELLRNQVELESIAKIKAGEFSSEQAESYCKQRIREIDSIETFLKKTNVGMPQLNDDSIQRLHEISKYTYRMGSKKHPLLTTEELENLSIRRGTLTEKERLIINGHMVDTLNMLNHLPFPKNLERVTEYAGCHHEKMDGTGYPRGIFAKDMSIPARIMVIADVFEALTASDRPYKKAFKLSESMKIMGDMKRNNFFDPELFDIFVSSKTYLKYARKYLNSSLIDEVNESVLLAIEPKGFPEPDPIETEKRWQGFLPAYRNFEKLRDSL